MKDNETYYMECPECHRQSDDIHKHHIVPRSKGGSDEPSNIQHICSDCHYKKHHVVKEIDRSQFNDAYYEAIQQNIFVDGWGILPRLVAHDKTISAFAKILYSEISSLCAEKGYCWATNKYLAGKFSCHEKTISSAVSELEKYIYMENRGGGAARRKMYVHTLTASSRQPRRKTPGNIEENATVDLEENATQNSISNNRKNKYIVTGDAGHAAKTPEKKKTEPKPIVWKDYLKTMKNNPNETVQVIALYFEEKKLKYETDAQAQTAIKRNLKASKRLIEAGWTPKQVFGAFSKAKADFKALWTLETIEKILLDHQS